MSGASAGTTTGAVTKNGADANWSPIEHTPTRTVRIIQAAVVASQAAAPTTYLPTNKKESK